MHYTYQNFVLLEFAGLHLSTVPNFSLAHCTDEVLIDSVSFIVMGGSGGSMNRGLRGPNLHGATF